jgi:hypothetical protein
MLLLLNGIGIPKACLNLAFQIVYEILTLFV